MLRAVTIACCLAALLGCAACGDDEEQASAPELADLTITLDRDGAGGAAPEEQRVECAAAGDSPACRAAAAVKPADLEPVPRRTACTLQFGGPEVATIEGTLRGEPVDARFSKENGCEISRWQAAQRLLEAAG